MSRRRSPQLRDIHRLGKIHLEQRPLAERQWNRILRILPRLRTSRPAKLLHRRRRSFHRARVLPANARKLDLRRRVISVRRREVLHDLHASPVPVHVAKPANVHQNVKPRLLPRTKCPRQFIVLPPVPQPEIDNFPPPCLARRLSRRANLPV